MLFLTPNQQCQSTEGKYIYLTNRSKTVVQNYKTSIHLLHRNALDIHCKRVASQLHGKVDVP